MLRRQMIASAAAALLAVGLAMIIERVNQRIDTREELAEILPIPIIAEIGRAVAAIPAGRDGVDGRDGIDGKDGQDGRDGRDGKDGRDGTTGRDGAEIQPLPAIDPAKSYPQGTWAKHAGGLWLSRAATDGMTGWDCIVNGLAAVQVQAAEDLRSVTFGIEQSSGAADRKTLTLPTMIHRGVWREEDLYHRGDSTTRDGSMWVLMTDEQKGKPGDDGSGWVLSVKRGRDGRDGLRGEKGERGAEGRAGKDLTQMTFDGRKY